MDNRLELTIDGIIYQLQSRGGISRIYIEILPRMCDMDDSLRVTLLTEGKLRQQVPVHRGISHRPIPDVELYLRPGGTWKPVVPHVRDLAKRLRVGRTDGKIWHSTYYTMLDHWHGRSVVTVPDMIHEMFPERFNDAEQDRFRAQKRRCIEAADAIICISETTAQDLQRICGIGSDRIHVTRLAHSNVFRVLNNEDNPSPLPTGEPFLLYVGIRPRYKYKNFDLLLDAYSAWPGRKETALVLVSSPWSVDEERNLAELGIRERVHLLTDVDDNTLCRLYNRAVAFVYPSLYEGFGVPLLEAMACGCPIVASRIPSSLEIAGECPIYFDPAETDELIQALDRVLDEGRDSERVRMGLERVKQYSWDRTVAQTLEVYRLLAV